MEKASTHYYANKGALANRVYAQELGLLYCSLFAAKRSRSSSSVSGEK